MKDKLINCDRCNSQMCYEVEVGNITTKSCTSCGFQTNNLLVDGDIILQDYESTLPELYKDLKHIDANGNVWYPLIMNVPEKGMVFINGKSKEEWDWAGMKSTLVEENEKHLFPKSPYKMDTQTLKTFGKEGFVQAMQHVGLL